MIERKKRKYNSRKREEGAEQTRLRILEGTRSLLLEESYTGITLDQIAERSGVARATVYLQFGSKLGVLEALAEYIDQIGLKELFAALALATDPLEALHKAVRLEFAFSHANARLLRTFRAQAVNDADFRTVVLGRLQQRRQNIERLVEWLLREGKLAEGWSVGEATDYLGTISSFPVYDELVNLHGWNLEQSIHRTLDTIDDVLLV